MTASPYLRLALLSALTAAAFARIQRNGVADYAVTAAMDNIDGEDPPFEEEPRQEESLIAMQFTADPHEGMDHLQMILDGRLELMSIRYTHNGSFLESADGDDSYSNVDVEFCDFKLEEHCGEHSYQYPLADIIREIAAYDSSAVPNKVTSLPVAGLLFHEGYSGAGLISNAIATFPNALVVSEHSALRDALEACDIVKNRYLVTDCDAGKQRRMVRDVVHVLSRTADPAKDKLYLKLSSRSSAYLPALRSLYPDAPWQFVYRDAADALAKATQRYRDSACRKAPRNPSSALAAKASGLGVDLTGITHHRACALHLASMLDVARAERERSGTGMLVSYDCDVGAAGLLEVILPHLGLGGEIAADRGGAAGRIAGVMGRHSNADGMMDASKQKWEGETIEISEEVRSASEEYLVGSTGSCTLMD